jgi:uncharacterized protein YjbI with pentapeptide repeats
LVQAGGPGGKDCTPRPGADLSGCNYAGANLANANLTDAILTGANLDEADLTNAILTGVTSGGITGLTAALPDLWLFFPFPPCGYLVGPGANLPGAELSGAELSGADISGANLTRANLTNAHLAGANLVDSDLSGANLTGADLSGAALASSEGSCSLSDANLFGANLTRTVLALVNINGANFSHADLTGIITSNLSGVPAALPPGWALKDGVLVQGSAPAAPAITGLSNGDGQVSVGVSDSDPGTSPITSYEVTATARSQPAASPVTATGPTSPILVTGLTNGGTYVFTATATNAFGTSPSSAPSGALNVGLAPAFNSGPANGAAGQAYSSGFTVTGAPAPAVTQVSGDLPPGLTLSSDGELTGTPTQAGSYEFTVEAVNDVGIADDTVTVTISPPAGPR